MSDSSIPDMEISPSAKCPCGSGKKYKKCCLLPPGGLGEEEIARRYALIRRSEGNLVPQLFQVFVDIGAEFCNEAYDIYSEMLPDCDATSPPFEQIFASWLLLDHAPFESEEPNGKPLRCLSAAEMLLQEDEETSSLSSNDRLFLQSGCRSEFSLYCVEDVRLGIEISLRDLLSQKTHIVREYRASELLSVGDVIFARILSVYQVNALFGLYPAHIPARYRTAALHLIDLVVAETPKALKRWPGYLEREVREALLREGFAQLTEDIAEEESQAPQMRNNDGDPFELLGVRFELACSISDTLLALKPLFKAGPLSLHDILASTEKDENGQIIKAEFPWCKPGNRRDASWDKSVLAHIHLADGELIATVNSEKRAKRTEQRLIKLLTGKAQFIATTPISPDEQVSSENSLMNAEDFAQHPEIRQQLEEMMCQRWEAWFDESIPMLDNATPREAVKTARGREQLDALFIEYARMNKNADDASLVPDIAMLKARLGLGDIQ